MTSIGVIIATRPESGGWAAIPGLAREAESAGVDRIWFTDHLFWHREAPDPLIAAALAASSTVRLGVGTLVLQLPIHQTASVAKAASFVDDLAGGRMILGVGVGEHRWEYDLAGVGERFGRRGSMMDVAITELRRHWAGEDSPPMAPSRDLPIWIGGRSASARRRAAHLGDCWIPHLCPLDWFRTQRVRLSEDLIRSGRDAAMAVSLLVHVDSVEPAGNPLAWAGGLYDLPPAVFQNTLNRGTAEQIADLVRSFEAAGASHVALFPASDVPVEHAAAIAEALMR